MGENIKINFKEIRSKDVDWTQPVIIALPSTKVGILVCRIRKIHKIKYDWENYVG
jgi:hypothetical protein